MDQPEQIERIHFISSSHGWAWGGGRKDQYSEQPGTFLTTIDGGQHWNEVPWPFAHRLWGVFFLNPTRAWASCEDGGFYTTTDGGLNWTRIQPKVQPEDVFYAIFFLDENNGWIAGRSGRLAKTADGGKTWQRQGLVRQEFKMRDIHFLSPDEGWAVGDEGAILYTANGGESWLKAESGVGSGLLDVGFSGKNNGWIAGLGGAVLKFTIQ